jgi:hypothetical protein
MDARLLLVHSPLVGPGTWDLVAAELAGRGWQVDVPDLTGTVTGGPPYCVRQAEVIARSTSGRPAILIGHSGAGPLLAAAGALAGQVRGYLFVDAGLPIPGQTWMETVPPELAVQVRGMADDQGWLPPWPQWWGEEVLAELIPDPAARQRFADWSTRGWSDDRSWPRAARRYRLLPRAPRRRLGGFLRSSCRSAATSHTATAPGRRAERRGGSGRAGPATTGP